MKSSERLCNNTFAQSRNIQIFFIFLLIVETFIFKPLLFALFSCLVFLLCKAELCHPQLLTTAATELLNHTPERYIQDDPVKSVDMNGHCKHVEVFEPALMRETVRKSATDGESNSELKYSNNGRPPRNGSRRYPRSPGRKFQAHEAMRVIVIGAGFSGIYCGVRIPQRLRHVDLCIYDKNAGVGGTWFENRYVEPSTYQEIGLRSHVN